MPDAYSVRQSLQGALHDFIRSAGFECVKTEEMVRELVCHLAAYREEDTPLYPEVYVTSRIAALNSLAPGTERVVVGRGNCGADIAASILKSTANLALRGWSIYVAKTENDQVEFGLFRSLRYSIATSAEESMQGLGTGNPMLLIRNRGHLVVEILDSGGHNYTVALTSAPASTSQLGEHVRQFTGILTGGLDIELRIRFRQYLERLFIDVLQRSHGSLLAAIDTGVDPTPSTLRDAVWISPPVSLVAAYTAAAMNKSAESLSDQQAAEVLLEGMINSDGVVVFGTNGSIVAFRAFLKPDDSERDQLPDTGGGRRRTFELMKLRVGTVLKGAFFRSQDGKTLCEGKSDDK